VKNTLAYRLVSQRGCSLLFAGNTGAYPNGYGSHNPYLKKYFFSLKVTNMLAYHAMFKISEIKIFTEQAPRLNFLVKWKLPD
jgi:hypothetical protein